jgi:hypothetical protein
MSGFAAVLAERSKNSWRYVKEFKRGILAVKQSLTIFLTCTSFLFFFALVVLRVMSLID